MTTTPHADTSINTMDLGVSQGRLEAGQESLHASLHEVRNDVKEAKSDIKFLLKFAWGATAVIALLVVTVPVVLTLVKPSPTQTEPQQNLGPQSGIKPVRSAKGHRP